MSKRGRIPKELWEHYRAMSVDVGKEIPFLGITSCMNEEERKMIGLIQVCKGIFKGDKKFVKFLDEFCQPFFEYMGRAKWGRDVVTDLGFALSTRKSKTKDVSDVLEFQPPKKT